MSKWIRSGDTVQVIAGNDKGKTGEVIAKSKDKILIKGINVRKKHMKPQGQNKMGQILQIEKPIHVSNVKLHIEDEPKAKVKLKAGPKEEKSLVYTKAGKEKVYRKVLNQGKAKKK